jgi:hypothetical protein
MVTSKTTWSSEQWPGPSQLCLEYKCRDGHYPLQCNNNCSTFLHGKERVSYQANGRGSQETDETIVVSLRAVFRISTESEFDQMNRLN